MYHEVDKFNLLVITLVRQPIQPRGIEGSEMTAEVHILNRESKICDAIHLARLASIGV